MLTCPYCNAELQEGNPSAACPRCGEKLPTTAASPPTPFAVPTTLAVVDRAKNRRTVRIILGLMLGIAACATIFILLTTDRRRRNDLPQLQLEAHPLPSAEESATIGMLPPGCAMLGEVKLRQLLKVKPGTQLMKQPLPGWIDASVGKVHEWIGMKLGDIDNIAIGMQTVGGLPRGWLIVETRKDLDQAWFDAKFEKLPERFRSRPLYQTQAGPFAGSIWLAYKRLAIVQLQTAAPSLSGWDGIPETPRHGLEGIDPALHTLFKDKRVEPEHLAWLVGTRSGLSALAPFALLGGVDAGPFTKDVEVFSLGLILRDKATLSANFFTGDDKKSEALKASLERLTQPLRDQVKIAGPQPAAPAAEQWVTMFLSLTIDELRDAFRKRES